MANYDHKKIESKWQKIWEKKKLYKAKDGDKRPKFYSLIEFPYPSGDGLHVGHIRSNTAMDIISRKRRMEGFNVLYPIGWDAFGLPTENYAIKTGIQPAKVTKKNADVFRRQLKAGGFSFDWDREIDTSDPKYYKWTQWIFIEMFKRGLAYKQKMTINWCPKDKIGLANEEVIDGKCERCDTPVEKREKEQWMLAITKYADRLDKDLDTVDYPEHVKIQQRNWIGKSEGAEIEFTIKPEKEPTFYQFFEPGKIKEDKPYVERNAIMALVKHWSEDKYIGLKWKKVPWETFITGGVEDNQTPEQAAILEIQQETGYKNIRLVKKLGLAHSKFFHVPKNQNRNGHFNMFVFQLENNERADLTEEEQANHDVIWLSEKDLKAFRLPSSHRYLFELYKNDGVPEKRQLKVFTTRPDTIFGVTYLVLAPEHPLINYFIHQASNASEVHEYVKKAKAKTEIDRTSENKEKTGVELKGVKAINPATNEEIPIFVADYVIKAYGTGAIMAVPAHDERDYEFAKKYSLAIREVVEPALVREEGEDAVKKDLPYVERNAVVAIIKHWSEDKYLCLKWKKVDWKGFVIGGIEKGENIETAGKREIQEETGYKNAKFIKQLGGTVHSKFYQAVKKENRSAHFTPVLFQLENDERNEMAQDEKELHDVVWISKDKVDEFINRNELKIIWGRVIRGKTLYTGEGILTNSGKFSGQDSKTARKVITEFAGGKITTTYKLRDWVFSRQRYWGEPIPLIYCEHCATRTTRGLDADSRGKKISNGELLNPGWVPILEKDLPVKLPNVKNYTPTDSGESPLASISKWVNTKCPVCKGKARRETDTMPNWAGSSWYYLAYLVKEAKSYNLKAKNSILYWSGISEKPEAKSYELKAGPVDWYNGGMEHTTLHLLYSRFWHKFLYDLKLVPTLEPYKKRTSHGLILAEGGIKMSKSKGNVVNPDYVIKLYGADTLRIYEMFMGPFDQAISWSTESIIGSRRFLEKVWRLQEKVGQNTNANVLKLNVELEFMINELVKKVSEDIEAMKFNTAISHMMMAVNEFEKVEFISENHYKTLLKLLAPFAPHVTEELWATVSHKKAGRALSSGIHLEEWPEYKEVKFAKKNVKIAIQVNGKVRDELEIDSEESERDIVAKALALGKIQKWTEGKSPKKTIYIKVKILNIVI